MLHGTIFGTIGYAAAFTASVVSLYRYRKSHKPMNGFTWVVLSFLSAVCMGGIAAGILSPLHIPINLYTMAVVYLAIALFMFFLIRREGMTQEYVWEK